MCFNLTVSEPVRYLWLCLLVFLCKAEIPLLASRVATEDQIKKGGVKCQLFIPELLAEGGEGQLPAEAKASKP